jgi:hypothetical protein
VHKLARKGSLEDAKRSTAKDYQARIEAVEKEIEEISLVVETGKTEGLVECEWLFETSGLDASGDPIYHSELKTLIRRDTGEFVAIERITQEDRQANLPLSDEEQREPNKAAIDAAGYTLEEAPEDSEWSFVLTGPDGVTEGIAADSMAGAAAIAAGMLPPVAPADTEGDGQPELEAEEIAA